MGLSWKTKRNSYRKREDSFPVHNAFQVRQLHSPHFPPRDQQTPVENYMHLTRLRSHSRGLLRYNLPATYLVVFPRVVLLLVGDFEFMRRHRDSSSSQPITTVWRNQQPCPPHHESVCPQPYHSMMHADDRFCETITTLLPVPPHDTADILESMNRASAKTKPLVLLVEQTRKKTK